MTLSTTLTPITLNAGSKSAWARAADAVFSASEAAEIGLAIAPDGSNIEYRLSTGSFYTPADVVEHFWREYADFHGLDGPADWRVHLSTHQLVEPSAGAGIFLFGLLSYLAGIGFGSSDLSGLKFVAVDINKGALEFISARVRRFETETGVELRGVKAHHGDFLTFEPQRGFCPSYIGNPPYVRNPAGARWRNLYADFIERMLDTPASSRAFSLIVPLSIAFSRDYASLRHRINGMTGVRLEAFDNIPDCLFPAGKPGHGNTNKANSQRCVILSAREGGSSLRQSTELRRWSRKFRQATLDARPDYLDFTGYDFDDQWPRPSAEWILAYLEGARSAPVLRHLCKPGPYVLDVANVARNYIGLREAGATEDSGTMRLTFASAEDFAVVFQILASPVFYEWWRSIGDGFHVTRSDVLDFPIAPALRAACVSQIPVALAHWRKRAAFERIKRNAGRLVRSYDFRGLFNGLLEAVSASDHGRVRAA